MDHLNRLDEPVFIAVPKPMLTEFGIQQRLKSCAPVVVCVVNSLNVESFIIKRFNGYNVFTSFMVLVISTIVKIKRLYSSCQQKHFKMTSKHIFRDPFC